MDDCWFVEDDSPPMSPEPEEGTPTLRLSPPVSPEPDEATLNKLSPYNKALYEKIQKLNHRMHKDKGENKGRSLLILNNLVWLKPEVIEAVKKYKIKIIPTLEKLRQVIRSKTGINVSTSAISRHVRNVKRGKQRDSSGERKTESTYLLNEHFYTTPQSQNLHTVIPKDNTSARLNTDMGNSSDEKITESSLLNDHLYTSPENLHTVSPEEDNDTYLNPEFASIPAVREALTKYRNFDIATLEELREVIHEKADVWIPTTALSWQLRNVRGNSGEKTSEFTPLLNDPTSGSKNLHTVSPQARKATSNVVKRNLISKSKYLDIWSKPAVIEALNKYRNFQIATLENLRQVIHDNANIWISTIALSSRARNMRKLGCGRPKGSEPKVSRAVNNYVVKPRGGDVALPALPLLYHPDPEENEAETTSGDVEGEVVNDESDLKSPSTSQVPATWVNLKTKQWRSRKRKLDKIASKTGRQVHGEFFNNRINTTVFQLREGPNRNYTYRLVKKSPNSTEEDPQRYSCAQCHYARYGARTRTKTRGLKGDDLAPLNPGPHKKIMVMPDGLVLDIDEGEHHQDCRPWTDAQMILYRERVDTILKRKMGIGKKKREHRKRSKEEQERYLDEKEKVRQCVMHLDALGVPITQIGPTINFIRETLAEFPLDIIPSYTGIKSIVYREKKKAEIEANGVIASSPTSVDRKVPKHSRSFQTKKVRLSSEVTLEYEEKVCQCVMRLDALGVPITQIGPTINFIRETLAEFPLDIIPSYKGIKSIIYRQKKKLEKEANCVIASPPISVDRKRSRPFQTKKVRSPSVRLEYEEKVSQCVMRLDAVGVPITQIGPTINFIRETLAEFPLDIIPSHMGIKSIVYRQKKKLEKQANGVIASPPSVDRKVPKRSRLFQTKKVRSPSEVSLEFEPRSRVVVIDDIDDDDDDDDDVQAPYFPYRDGPDGYGKRRYNTSEDYSF